MRSCSETRLTSMPFSLRLLSSRLCRQPITGVIIVERICNSKKKIIKKSFPPVPRQLNRFHNMLIPMQASSLQ